MCTVSVILRQSKRFPLVVAANRDEHLARPSRAPFVWERTPRIFAGRDERAGGTWMGVNEHGVFAGLANLYTGEPPDPSLRSRGEVVLEVLGAATVEEARERIEAVPAGSTNPFILVCANVGGRAFWTASREGSGVRGLEAGVHAFGNALPGSGNRKMEDALQVVKRGWDERGTDDPASIRRSLAGALGTHSGNRGPAESLCVHLGEPEVFGTVSSTLFLGAPGHTTWRCYHAAGAPCRTAFRDVSGDLARLFD